MISRKNEIKELIELCKERKIKPKSNQKVNLKARYEKVLPMMFRKKHWIN